MCRALMFVVLAGSLSGWGSAVAAHVSDGATDNGRIRVERDPETFLTKVKIRANHENEVAWTDVFRGLARARGYDDTALADLPRKGRFSITGPAWLLTAAGINRALKPAIQFGVEPGETQTAEPWLVVQMDRAALLASQRRFNKLFRQTVSANLFGGGNRYGLFLEDGWDELPGTSNLVVFVHGFESSPEALVVLLDRAKSEGLPCGVFSYPNDQAIDDSASALANELTELAQEHPHRGVAVVAHSMGGLVCRAVIEDPDRDPGNVRQLIMIAPPSHGSNLAHFGFALDVTQAIRNDTRRSEAGSLYATIEDGLSEASDDLIPNSPFLKQLNDRERNPTVAYTIFLGKQGIISEDELFDLRRRIGEQGNQNRWVRFFGSRAVTLLADLDEVVQGKGDGVVAVKRGRLDGVEDTIVLDFGHTRVLERVSGGDVQKVQDGVFERLQRKNSR